jgi:hypothetical protein
LRTLCLQIGNRLVGQLLAQLDLFESGRNLLVGVLAQSKFRPYKIGQLLDIHLRLGLQNQGKCKRAKAKPPLHIQYDDVFTHLMVAWPRSMFLLHK